MIDNAKILKLCNIIEDTVTELAAKCETVDRANYEKIVWKLKAIEEEINETHGHWIACQAEGSGSFDHVRCSICGYNPDTDTEGLGDMRFCASCGHKMDDANGAPDYELWNSLDVCVVIETPEEWKVRTEQWHMMQ